MVLEEENRSLADTDPFVGDAMDMDEPLDISEPMDKDSEVPVSPASAPLTSPMTGRERKERYKTAITSKRKGVKRLEATRSKDELMEEEAEVVSKRRKQSSTAGSRPTMASVPTTIDQTPARATNQGFASINQSSLPPPTRPTVDPVQKEALSSALSCVQLTQPRPQLSFSSSSAQPTIHPNPPVGRTYVDPVEQEETFRKMNQHVLLEGAHEALRDLLQWHFKNRTSGVEGVSDVSQNTLSLLRIGPSHLFAATPTTFREAFWLVSHDIGQSLLSELIRRYHLAP